MIFSALFERGLFTIRRATPGGRDALGRPVLTETAVATVDGLLQQTGTAEGEAFVVDKFRALMPIGTDLRAKDKVLARGAVYTVEGTPFTAHAPGAPTVGVVTAILQYVGPVTS